MAEDSDPTQQFLAELRDKLDPSLYQQLRKRDGAAHLSHLLPLTYSPAQVNAETNRECRAWELCGLFYYNLNRPHEALLIFQALYGHMIEAQGELGIRVHKGMPLVWIADCYQLMGFAAIGKRYLMLALCEDAITTAGVLPIDTSGVYIRLVCRCGLADTEFQCYSKQAYELSQDHPAECRYPEWVLQQLDKNWMIEYPSHQEAAIYSTNPAYTEYLIKQLGDQTGHNLEMLADYLLSCMPGCRTTRRCRSHSSDYDIVCSMEGLEVDFRSEFGRYFVCECKDWKSRADFTTMAKFCRVLDSTKSRFGILFSKNGLSGQGTTQDAAREQLKVYQDRGMVIVVVDLEDITKVAKGQSFVSLLREKYERVRLDLMRSDND